MSVEEVIARLARDEKKYRRALERVMYADYCACGGLVGSDSPAYTVGNKSFPHVVGCGILIAARALGRKIKQVY